MTDLEKLKNLLDEFGIVYEEAPSENIPPNFRSEKGTDIIISSEDGPKNLGHFGFYTDFAFDKDGKFVEMGSWE